MPAHGKTGQVQLTRFELPVKKHEARTRGGNLTPGQDSNSEPSSPSRKEPVVYGIPPDNASNRLIDGPSMGSTAAQYKLYREAVTLAKSKRITANLP
jgi:hypothetical protein